MEGSYYLEHKEKFREYGVKYYNSNKHEVNKRRLLRRIAAGAPIRKNLAQENALLIGYGSSGRACPNSVGEPVLIIC